MRLAQKGVALATLAQRLMAGQELIEGEVRSGSRRTAAVRARREFRQVAGRGSGYSGAALARF